MQPFSQFHDDDPGVGRRHGCYYVRSLAPRPLAEMMKRHVPSHHRRDPGAEVAPHRSQRV